MQIKNYARVADSIVGWGSRLGTWSRLENHSVIGEDVFVRDEVLLNGAIVLPHKVRPCLFTNANNLARMDFWPTWLPLVFGTVQHSRP